MLKFKALDTVALERDLPEYGLQHGDLGAVVEVYPPDGLEVEFVRGSGKPRHWSNWPLGTCVLFGTRI